MRIPKRGVLVLILLSMLFLSSCFTIDINQKLKRTGLFDLEVVVSSDVEGLFDGASEQIKVQKDVEDKAVITQGDGELSIKFNDLDPNSYTSLFEESGDTDSSFLDGENIRFERDFRFPYYYFTYAITTGNKEVESGPSMEYIDDTLSLLSNGQKSAILENIQAVHEKNNIHVLVHTVKEDEDFSDFIYPQNYMTTRSFIDSSEVYVTLYVTEGDLNYCYTDANMFFYPQFNAHLDKVKGQNGNLCGDNKAGWIERIVSEIRAYSDANDVQNENTAMDIVESVFTINFNVEVFGSIVSTNGKKLNRNTVQFKLDPASQEEYVIEFKDFFLITALSHGGSDVVVAIIFLLIVAGMFWLMYLQLLTFLAGRKLDKKIVGIVRRARLSEMSDTELRKILEDEGLDKKQVRLAMRLK